MSASPDSAPDPLAELARLRDPATIRARAEALYALAQDGQLQGWTLHEDRLPQAVARVAELTRRRYPSLEVPVHGRFRHFEVGHVDRVGEVLAQLEPAEPLEQAQTLVDLTVTSVLLDAGAGPSWRYSSAGQSYSRSEGLAVASVDLFRAGLLSADSARPLQADAAGLQALTPAHLGQAFQVRPGNPLVGLEGRTELLNRLGQTLAKQGLSRVGDLLEGLPASLPARDLLGLILERLGEIWPGRLSLAGHNLGDVWEHAQAPGGRVPFHKLSQWLSYSLLEPLAVAGIAVTDLDQLTGLAEYRNGGLFVDSGVLSLTDPRDAERAHPPASPLIVGWRALTLALLDRVAAALRSEWSLSAEQLPLAKVLEGGTWAAGRELARERRPDGSPPLRLESDGTVF